MTEPQKPKPAATVILLRSAPPAGFEVLLIRRPDGMAFLGGMHCFPGGAVAKEDCAPEMLRRCHGLTPARARSILGAHLKPQEALGFWVAGIRELFEETGVLLAIHLSGEAMESRPSLNSNLGEKQSALLTKNLSFRSLLESEDLYCDLSHLAYFSSWQTPSRQPMRFDTRFFLAALPEGQSPLPTSPEVARSLWLTPDRALQLFARNELPMIFPTFASLRALANFDSVDGVLRQYSGG